MEIESKERIRNINTVEVQEKPIMTIEREKTGYNEAEKIEITDTDLVRQFKETTIKYTALASEILEISESARSSDLILYLEVLKQLGYAVQNNKELIINLTKLKFFPTPETISRLRRKLNENGLYISSNPYIIEMRSKREKIYKTLFKKT